MSSTHERPSVDQPAAAADQPRIPSPRPVSEPVGGYASSPSDAGDVASGYASAAGWLLILGGLWDFFVGLALLVRSSYFSSLSGYSATHHYSYGWTLSGWGWANLIFGIVVAAVGACVLLGMDWARWAGLVLAVLGAIGSFMFLPIYPFWSILVIAVDVFIVWALATARRHREMPA